MREAGFEEEEKIRCRFKKRGKATGFKGGGGTVRRKRK